MIKTRFEPSVLIPRRDVVSSLVSVIRYLSVIRKNNEEVAVIFDFDAYIKTRLSCWEIFQIREKIFYNQRIRF